MSVIFLLVSGIAVRFCIVDLIIILVFMLLLSGKEKEYIKKLKDVESVIIKLITLKILILSG